MNYEAGKRMYTSTHEWISFEDDKTAYIGITDFAQESLGELVFVNFPDTGAGVSAGQSFGEVESVKAASGINSPVTGTVAEINEELSDTPEKINSAPYEAWLIKAAGITDTVELMDENEYMELVRAEKDAE